MDTSRLLKLATLLCLLLPATRSRATDYVSFASNQYFGWGALFYPQQGLNSRDCQYHLVKGDRPEPLYVYFNGWTNRKLLDDYWNPYVFGYNFSGYQLDADTGHLKAFNGVNGWGQVGVTDFYSDQPKMTGGMMYLQGDGNLCVVDTNQSAVWCSMWYQGVLGPSDCRPYNDHPLANSYTMYFWGVDFPFNDTNLFPARSYYECGAICTSYYAIGQCDLWTYVGDERNGTCYLKTGNPSLVLHPGDRRYVSGRILKG
jgi:hypothetical protein